MLLRTNTLGNIGQYPIWRTVGLVGLVLGRLARLLERDLSSLCERALSGIVFGARLGVPLEGWWLRRGRFGYSVSVGFCNVTDAICWWKCGS